MVILNEKLSILDNSCYRSGHQSEFTEITRAHKDDKRHTTLSENRGFIY